MKLLLDKHSLIWFSENDPMLSQPAKQAIESPNNIRFVSMASFWEMAIKLSIGKLALKKSLSDIIPEAVANGFDLLPMESAHILQVEKMPFFHRDPFDRMLIAQALSDDLTLVSNEAIFEQYGTKRLW